MKARVIPFHALCRLTGLPEPIAEFRFDAVRKWRWDYAWPSQKVALEVNGGVWTQGKHSRGGGQLKDFEKWSEGAAQGWRLLHVIPSQLEDAGTFDWIRRSLERRQ